MQFQLPFGRRPPVARDKTTPAPGTAHAAPSVQHSALNTQHSALNTQHSAHNTQHAAPNVQHAAPPLEFVRHPRAKRYVIRLTEGGTVRVTIPRWGSRREAEAFAARERQWIEKQWHRMRAARAAAPAAVADPAIERAARERAKRELPPRLLELAARHGFADGAVTKISVRNQKWRWGSCSPNGHICLNWRLVQMPDAVRDYVLIHELMHLKRMDHSPKFWKLVASACPDYRELRKYLRTVPR